MAIADDINHICRFMPRLKDALNMTLHRYSIRQAQLFTFQAVERPSLRAVNQSLGEVLVDSLHVFRWRMIKK